MLIAFSYICTPTYVMATHSDMILSGFQKVETEHYRFDIRVAPFVFSRKSVAGESFDILN